MERGYASVTLRDIAAEAGIQHTSLYHHAPGGKQALFTAVIERAVQRHRDGMEAAIARAGDDWQGALRAVAHWMLSQPPMNLMRMRFSDLTDLPPQEADRLSSLAFRSLKEPVEGVLRRAQSAGAIEVQHTGMMAAAVLSLVQSLHAIPAQYVLQTREEMADELLRVLARGMQKSSLE